MRARLARQSIIVIGVAAVLAGWLARTRAQSGAAAFVFAPGDEVDGAALRGKADVATAQGLARKKKYAEAVALLEKVAVAQPSVVHDCNLSLAYLRAGQLTRAQLVWDVSRLRGAQPPDWCDASLSGQLAGALRTKGYVPLTISVEPPSATVEVGDVVLRGMSLVWLPPKTYTVRASAGGYHNGQQPVLVAAPSATVTLLLTAIGDPVVEIDAPMPTAPPTDAGVVTATPVDAADVDIDLDNPPPLPPPARARWPGYAGVGTAGLGLGLGIAFHVRALGTKDRANMLPSDSMPFRDARDKFGTERAVAIGGYVVSAAAIGFTAWWWLGKDSGEPPTRTVGIEPRGDGAVLTFGGSFE